MRLFKEDFIVEPNWLITHCLVLGMTGSGKTGLGMNILEELAKLNIPTLVFDIKGDLTNLCKAGNRTYVPESAAETPPEASRLLNKSTIVYLAHLVLDERIAVIKKILVDLESYMRTQAGHSGLRAFIYIDEIQGLVPPVKNPPVKDVLLTLLKQGRAFGYALGLSTQNPGDLDYRALSNIGTWFIGKLNTVRDREKVAEGLQFPAGKTTIGKLGNREFLFRSVHTQTQDVFSTRDSDLVGLPVTLKEAVDNLDPDFGYRYVCKEASLVSAVGAAEDCFLLQCKKELLQEKKNQYQNRVKQLKDESKLLASEIKKLQKEIKREQSKRKNSRLSAAISIIAMLASISASKTAITPGNISRAGSALKDLNKSKISSEDLAILVEELDKKIDRYSQLQKDLSTSREPLLSDIHNPNIQRVDLWSALTT